MIGGRFYLNFILKIYLQGFCTSRKLGARLGAMREEQTKICRNERAFQSRESHLNAGILDKLYDNCRLREQYESSA